MISFGIDDFSDDWNEDWSYSYNNESLVFYDMDYEIISFMVLSAVSPVIES